MALKLQEIYSGDDALLYVTSPSWTFGLDDEEERQFGVLFEIMDLYEATGEEEYEDYPYSVEASIVADQPSAEFAEEQGWEGIDPSNNLMLIEAAYRYTGGVPITHIVETEIGSSSDKMGLQPLLKGIAKRDYKIFQHQPEFGTVAAQRGPRVLYESPRFKTMEAAQKYVKNMLPRLEALGVMIGFILDRPINLMGNSGWTTMETYVRGPRRYNPTSAGTSDKKLKTKLLR